MKDKKRGQRRDVGIIDQKPTQFSLKNELGEVAVFSGITGEFLRYEKPANDGVLCYFEYPEEDVKASLLNKEYEFFNKDTTIRFDNPCTKILRSSVLKTKTKDLSSN